MLLGQGSTLFTTYCAACHALDGERIGQVEPIELIGTDRSRLDSFDPELAEAMNTLGAGKPWKFTHFRSTDGYANAPIDGLWLRAPYLHNGSVPTLADLLAPPRIVPPASVEVRPTSTTTASASSPPPIRAPATGSGSTLPRLATATKATTTPPTSRRRRNKRCWST